jgi:hypothetical protein
VDRHRGPDAESVTVREAPVGSLKVFGPGPWPGRLYPARRSAATPGFDSDGFVGKAEHRDRDAG